MADKVEIEISAKDNASKQINNVEKSVDTLGKSAINVGNLFKAYLTIETVKMAYNLAKLGAEAEETQRAFKSFTKDGDAMVRKLQEISKGVIDDEDAMKSIMKTAQLLGQSGVDNIAKLTEVARASSVAFGGNTQDNLDKLTTGIARMSERQLTTMGITIDTKLAYEEYANTLGKTATELTDAEKRQAFMNAVIEKGQGIVKQYGKEGQTSAEMFASFETSVKDLGETLGRVLIPILTPVVNGLNSFSKALGNVLADFGLIKNMDAISTLESDIRKLKDTLAESESSFDKGNTFGGILSEKTMADNVENMQKIKNQITEKETMLEGLKNKTIEVNNIISESTIKTTGDVQDSMYKMYEANKQFEDGINNIMMGGVLSSLDTLGTAFFNLASGTENAWGKMGKSMIITTLDVVKQIMTAYLSLAVAKALVDGNWGAVAGIGAGIVGVSALQASASNISFGGEETASNNSTSSSSSGSQSSPSVSDGGGSGMSGGGQGNLVINLYNPTFMDKSTKEKTIDDLLMIAQNYGWNITKNSSVVVA